MAVHRRRPRRRATAPRLATYPNEVEGVFHPTYGHRPWVKNQYRPFLGPAADAKASDAMKRFAEKYDRLLAKAGFK
jgi:hypothetical protein